MQGAAAVCTAPQRVELAAGQQAEATMVVKNDGGWCGIMRRPARTEAL